MVNSRWSIISFALVLVACTGKPKPVQVEAKSDYIPSPLTFCEDSAYQYVAQQCSYGPRTMNSRAHDLCGDWIAGKFRSFGLEVCDQYADGRLYDGTKIRMRNIIASFRPELSDRIIISGHWDSRPWADNDDDESKHTTPIDGANDGASSIAVLLELARILSIAQADTLSDSIALPDIGIDFICWDAEDSGTHGRFSSSTWCLGSQYWANHRHAPDYDARYGINLDMVGSAQTVFCRETISMQYAPTVVSRVWNIARQAGYGRYFLDTDGGEITDDHVPLCRSGIPCIDIIGVDSEQGTFPRTWHTIDDNLDNIHRPTLKAVGQTMLEVICNL